jgi:hypothetical protein
LFQKGVLQVVEVQWLAPEAVNENAEVLCLCSVASLHGADTRSGKFLG